MGGLFGKSETLTLARFLKRRSAVEPCLYILLLQNLLLPDWLGHEQSVYHVVMESYPTQSPDENSCSSCASPSSNPCFLESWPSLVGLLGYDMGGNGWWS